MALLSLVLVLLLSFSEFVVGDQTEADASDNIVSTTIDILEGLFTLIIDVISNVIDEILNPPVNRNSSIQYLLFTPATPNEACYLESNINALIACPFNASYPMKFLIHGFLDDLSTNPMWEIKDEMLALYNYNVIVVNWTRYNKLPYTLACLSTFAVGWKLAKLIHFLQNNTAIEVTDIHLIGHSLGAHVAGTTGRHVSNLGRITGLDPAAPLFYHPNGIFVGLTYKAANFVDVIHSSNVTNGYGIDFPVGHMDFFPNGGYNQPQCQPPTVIHAAEDILDPSTCNHAACIRYFFESLNTTKCVFLSTMCNNYTDFMVGDCSDGSSPMAEMGLPAQPIPGLDPNSNFYLITTKDEPYCKKDGYEPN